jgi:uncharacterized protein RhaS with RHS repeats
MVVGAPQSFNRYAYVQNDPVNFTDPTGLNIREVMDVMWSNFSGHDPLAKMGV